MRTASLRFVTIAVQSPLHSAPLSARTATKTAAQPLNPAGTTRVSADDLLPFDFNTALANADTSDPCWADQFLANDSNDGLIAKDAAKDDKAKALPATAVINTNTLRLAVEPLPTPVQKPKTQLVTPVLITVTANPLPLFRIALPVEVPLATSAKSSVSLPAEATEILNAAKPDRQGARKEAFALQFASPPPADSGVQPQPAARSPQPLAPVVMTAEDPSDPNSRKPMQPQYEAPADQPVSNALKAADPHRVQPVDAAGKPDAQHTASKQGTEHSAEQPNATPAPTANASSTVWTPVSTHAAAPVHASKENAVSAPTPPQFVEPAQQPAAPAAALRQFVLQLDGPERVDLRFTSTGGGVQISVMAGDTQLAQHLNSDIGSLVHKLEQAGYHPAQTGSADATPAPAGTEQGSLADTAGRQQDSQAFEDRGRRQAPQQELEEKKTARAKSSWSEIFANAGDSRPA